jgi:hypothetical protein
VGATLIDSVARGPDRLQAAGDDALQRPSDVVHLDAVTLRAPINY